MVYLLPLLSYFDGRKSASPALPNDPNMMTITALEVTASSNGNNVVFGRVGMPAYMGKQ